MNSIRRYYGCLSTVWSLLPLGEWDQCLHSAEADVRPPRRKSGFDPNPTKISQCNDTAEHQGALVGAAFGKLEERDDENTACCRGGQTANPRSRCRRRDRARKMTWALARGSAAAPRADP